MPKISIIIPTLNSERFIRPCLDSLFAQDNNDLEVIVADNGSVDKTVAIIEKDYPQAALIKNEENLGAAKARNQAIDISAAEWILALDCDTVLERGFLREMTGIMEAADSSIGMFQPKILGYDKKTIYSCGIYLSRFMRFHDIGRGRKDAGRFDRAGYIFGACSAAAGYKRAMLDDVKGKTGYFDEKLFFLAEDVDLAWRAQKKGWKTAFCPKALCYHCGNSSNISRPMRQYLCFRNRYLLMLKNNKPGIRRDLFVILLYDLPRLFWLMLTNIYIWRAWREIRSLASLEKDINNAEKSYR